MSTRKTPPASDLKSFRAAYETLQKHAHQLRTQTEPNIDDLLTLVNESVEAYKVCKTRIDAVEKALQEALDDPELSDLMEEGASASGEGGAPGGGSSASQQDDDPAASPKASSSTQSPAGDDEVPDLDDEIPF
ncbi:MAG TPA: hypothetical protein VK104_04320 [Burkholderiaceae bacterium]|nr:hypothetical protein [Burkholderiaceae bacterium]